MNTLFHIAQAVQTPIITSGPDASEAVGVAAALAIFATMFLFFAFVAVIGYVLTSLFTMRIFKKAGAPGWAAWVPIYNSWKMLEIGGQQGFWAVLAIIPIVNIVSAVMMYIAMYHIGLKLGKSGAFLVLGIFLPFIWLIWLAVDKSTWDDSRSSAPSLHKSEPVVEAPAAPSAE